MNTITPETFRIGFGKTRLGSILIAQTEMAIVAILFGNTRGKLRSELAEAFPNAHLADEKREWSHRRSDRLFHRRASERLEPAARPAWIGAISVAFSAKGVASIMLGDDPEAFVRDFYFGPPLIQQVLRSY